jgi:hypothetical protein
VAEAAVPRPRPRWQFATLWDLHEVTVRRAGRVRVDHPAIGPIEPECETLLSPAEDQRRTIFTPPPGTSNIDNLSLLRSGPRRLHPRRPRTPLTYASHG